MPESKGQNFTLSATGLKLMACLFMLIDHVGVRLFPDILLMRIIGRLAFPIFAFFIAEGCRYTSNRKKHFLSVFLLGCLCEIVYIIYSGAWYGNILFSFTLSILLIYLMQWCREKNTKAHWLLMGTSIVSLAVLVHYVNFDYGFTGIMSAVVAAWPGDRYTANTSPASARNKARLLSFAICIMLTAFENPLALYQLFALLSIPLLAIYSNKAGKKKLKYFFYIFYPVHLLLIEVTAMILGK